MTDKKSTSQTISKIINLLIGIIVFWTWSCMTFRLGRLGAQSTGGFSNLRYFTVLSNLFQGVVSLAYFFGRKVSRLKYAATTAIAFTFIVVLCFLGPTRGYDSVYSGANFFSHLVVPVLAIADFLIFEYFLYWEPLHQRNRGQRFLRVCQRRNTGRSTDPSPFTGGKLGNCSGSQASQKGAGFPRQKQMRVRT